ncbi:hypothetical protein RB601_009663 [Gaeumannomyces tritici]
MSAAVTQPPSVPPRPSRSQDRDQMPKIPPRPVNRRLEQSSSPSRGRFAPSPLNENPLNSAKSPPQIFGFNGSEPIDRSSSVDLPSLGEEGREYAAFASDNNFADGESSSPEQTANINQNLKLHAPKPSLPALSAKQRVAAVTRTDSDKAASFGIGKPSSEDPVPSNRSLKKKASTTSQLSANTESHMDDEHGIPEIGKQVPMYPHAGDVQAPSPAPGSEGLKPKHHNRKTSARGFTSELPPGSYGLHGHGVKSQDKLEKAYYEKHPELVHKESNKHHHDRPNDFSMSREELNKIVRATAERGTSNGFGTPTEQCGWEAIEETASRITSPRPASTAPNSPELKRRSFIDGAVPESGLTDDQVIHVGDPKRRSVMFDDKSPEPLEGEDGYTAPILAGDEVANNASDLQPAVSPPAERSGSAFEIEPSSRPSSRPASIYRDSSIDVRSTPLEDVQEYEPLFPEDEKTPAKEPQPDKKKEAKKQRFPSRDIWEDAPDSVHEGAEVSTPDISQENDGVFPLRDVPARDDSETPAHAFARRQEQLAEDESKQSPDGFLHRNQKPSWVQGQSHIAKEVANEKRPSVKRFPSRDVWEDTPDSLQLETVVSQEQDEAEDASPVEVMVPELPQGSVSKSAEPSSAAIEKPVVPERPKSKQPPSDDAAAAKPTVPERPRPQVPARPTKQGSGSSKDGEAAASPDTQSKPVIPSRPGGSKIAALQAGFMADLNKRLQLGPHIPKVEEPAAQDEPAVEQEKAPLVDARKGRARGPQRRAPAKSAAPAAAAAAAAPSEKPVLSLSFSSPLTLFSIDPDQDHVSVGGIEKSPATEKPPVASEAVEGDKASAEPAAPPAKEAERTETAESTEEAKPETLATNMAGESVVAVDVEEKKAVEPAAAE